MSRIRPLRKRRKGTRLYKIQAAKKARNNEKARQHHRRMVKMLVEKGYILVHFWLERSSYRQALDRAHNNGFSGKVLLRAALERGLRTISISELVMAERKWRELVGYPAATPHAFLKADRTPVFPTSEMRRIKNQKLKAMFGTKHDGTPYVERGTR